MNSESFLLLTWPQELNKIRCFRINILGETIKFLLVLGFVLSTVTHASGLKFDQNKTSYEVLETAFQKSKSLNFEDIVTEEEADETGKFYVATSAIGPKDSIENAFTFRLTTLSSKKIKKGESDKGPLFPGRGTPDSIVDVDKQIMWCLRYNGYDVDCKISKLNQEFPEGDTLTMIHENLIHVFKKYNKKTIVIQSKSKKTGAIFYSYAWLSDIRNH